MTMQQRPPGNRRKRELEPAGARLASEIVLEQQRLVGKTARRLALHQRRNLVAEAVEAAWFEPDYRDATIDVRRERSDGALGFAPCLIDAPDRQKRAPAA